MFFLCHTFAYWKHAGEHHDLEPPRGRDGLKRRKAARRNVGELQVLRDGEVARETDSSLNRDDVEESEHRRAPLFLTCVNELSRYMLKLATYKMCHSVKYA